MKVKDVMSKNVKGLSPDMTVKEALDIFFKTKRTGLLVIDEKTQKVVGTFTEKDILKHVLPTYIENVGRFIYDENPKSVKIKTHEMFKMKIGDIMFKDVVTVDEDTTLCEVAHLMITKNIRQMPVVDKTGRLIGVIGRHDVVSRLIEEEVKQG